MTLNSPLLEIKNLQVSINDNKILKNLNLRINKGEIHAIMGPNGSGKSTKMLGTIWKIIEENWSHLLIYMHL